VPNQSRPRSIKISWLALLILSFAFVLSFRFRLLNVPLERDEGEYAYLGQLMLQGVPPYQLAYSMKFPGVFAAYAVIMSIFGETPAGIHLGLCLVNVATAVLLFSLAWRLFDWIAGVATAASFLFLSISPSVLGLAGHATHFVMLFVIAGALLLLKALQEQSPWRFFASGMLFGTGILMKQPAIAFSLFGATYLLGKTFKTQNRWVMARWLTIYCVGNLLPIGATLFLLWRAGVFPNFWRWTIQYAHIYAGSVPLEIAWNNISKTMVYLLRVGLLLWLIALLGLSACVWNQTVRSHALFLAGLFFFSAIALSAGLNFREHYFILLLPSLSLCIGAFVFCLRPGRSSLVVVAAFGIAFAQPLLADFRIFFTLPADQVARAIYQQNPFPEAVAIAKYLRANTSSEDNIAVLGSEPEIYFYSGRRSATSYIYMYPLLEWQPYAVDMQHELISQITVNRPKFVVFVSIARSWSWQPPPLENILPAWFDQYSSNELTSIGLVNIVSMNRTDYCLPCHPNATTSSPYHISIYQRKRSEGEKSISSPDGNASPTKPPS